MVALDAPDFFAATDLAERLRAYGPLLTSNGGDGCRLTIASASSEALPAVLATAHEWARHWELPEVPLWVGRRSYTLGSQPTTSQAGQARPKLLFFHSPRSGRCRRAEALVAQVLQHRRNHETFDLVRISVEAQPDLARQFDVDEPPAFVVVEGRRVAARLASPQHSHEIESLLRPWLR